MRLVKQKSEFDINMFFKEDDRFLSFTFGGNGDLYWSIYLRDANDSDYGFTITKENYGVYSLFEKLFDDIDKVNDPRYRLYDLSQYNLYDSANKVITWYSDETAYVVANILKSSCALSAPPFPHQNHFPSNLRILSGKRWISLMSK